MKNVKIIIVVVALVAAVSITVMTGGKTDTKEMSQEETRTPWMCAECKHPFQLTAAQVEEESKQGSIPPVSCPSCKARRALVAVVCEKCGTYYFNAGVEDSSGQCPKCFPDAKALTEEEQWQSLPEEVRPKEEDFYTEDPVTGQKVRKKPIKGA